MKFSEWETERLMEIYARAVRANDGVMPAHHVAKQWTRCAAAARRLRKFAEEDCNVGLSDTRRAARDRAEWRAVESVICLGAMLGAWKPVAVETQRDPRGHMVVCDDLWVRW